MSITSCIKQSRVLNACGTLGMTFDPFHLFFFNKPYPFNPLGIKCNRLERNG